MQDSWFIFIKIKTLSLDTANLFSQTSSLTTKSTFSDLYLKKHSNVFIFMLSLSAGRADESWVFLTSDALYNNPPPSAKEIVKICSFRLLFYYFFFLSPWFSRLKRRLEEPKHSNFTLLFFITKYDDYINLCENVVEETRPTRAINFSFVFSNLTFCI
jgi:hypothetical protein